MEINSQTMEINSQPDIKLHCVKCGDSIQEIIYDESGSYRIENNKIISGGGLLSVAHTCGEALTHDQLITLGFLE